MNNTTTLIPLNQIVIPDDARSHDPIALKQLTQDMKMQGQLQEIIVVRSSAQSTVNSAQPAVNSEQSTVNSAQPAVNSEQSTVNSKKKTRNSSLSTDPDSLSTVHSPLSTDPDSLSNVHSPLSTDQYEVIAGVGRTLAAKELGWKAIRASVRENVTEFERARITFAENEDREDVDAFYQAGLIARMLKEKKSQAELARELGISKALVSSYVTIAGLPEQISKTFRRLNVGQLDQIARLNSTNSQIAMATKCASNDWSVRETKVQVEKILGAKEQKAGSGQLTAVSLVDPLASEWEKAQEILMGLATTRWEATYRTATIPGTKIAANAWTFTVWPPQSDAPDAAEPKEAIARWFSMMAGALDGTFEGGAPVKSSEQQLLESSRKEQSMMKKIGKLMGV